MIMGRAIGEEVVALHALDSVGRAGEWTTEFVVVESVKTADAAARVDATCVTKQGEPVVTKL